MASAKALIEAFQAANPNITVKPETRPGGSEGDNLVKTRLATGDMADVFVYNNGSLLQAIKPEQNLAPLDDQPWAGQIDELFAASSKGADGKLYGGPYGTAFGGGVLYNIPLYEKLGLEIPKTWDEFMANNEKIKADGSAAPVEQTYGETWTSQLFVLGDYDNVEQAVPNFAADYTANKAKYATTPEALAGFEHIQEVKDAGYLNKDFASATLNDGIKAVATGTAAHYPQLGGVSAEHRERRSGQDQRRRLLRPARRRRAEERDDGVAGHVGACTSPSRWRATSSRRRRSSSRSPTTQQGCDAYTEGSPPQGPFLSKACKLPADVSQVAKDTQAYFDSGNAGPGAGVQVADQGPGPGADLHPGRHRSGDAQKARRALRPGRQEAGPAARSAGLGLSHRAEPVDGPSSRRVCVRQAQRTKGSPSGY